MPEPESDDFTIGFDYHGVELTVSDFSRDLRGWVAYSIAFTLNTHCSDKEAALELLYSTADSIARRLTGTAFGVEDDDLDDDLEDLDGEEP